MENLEFKLTPKQWEAFQALNLPSCEKNWRSLSKEKYPIDVLYGGGKGGGKAQVLTSQVLTPFGFKKMGDIKLGDMVCCPDGTTTRVIQIHPQGKKQIYKVTTIDGGVTRVTGDHLWRASIVGRTIKRKGVSGNSDGIYTTMELIDWIKKKGNINPNVLIPLSEEIQFTVTSRYSKARWPIDPYALGVLLGDGCLVKGTPTFTTADHEIVDEMKKLHHVKKSKCGSGIRYSIPDNGETKQKLKTLGLLGHKAYTKFVPARYKNAPSKIRWGVVQGLMDTDGHVDERGHVEFVSTSEKLAKDLQWIIRSLGGKATVTEKIPTLNGVECHKAWRLYINIRNSERLFRLTRKRERCTEYNNGCGKLQRRIVSIEPDGVEEAQCITLRHPEGLYITDDFIVTHNSWLMCIAAYTYAVTVADRFKLKPAKEVPHIGMLCRKTSTDFVATTLETWKSEIPESCYRLVPGSEKHARHILINERVAIDYGGLDSTKDINKFNSSEYGFMGVDQAEEVPKDLIAVLMASRRMTLRMPGKDKKYVLPYRGLFTANPRNCWLKEDFIDYPKPGKVFIPALYTDNRHLPNNYGETMEDAFSHRPDLLRAYKLGLWDGLEDIDQVILSDWVTAAKHRYVHDAYTKRIVAVDPARFGDDQAVIGGIENTRLIDVMAYSKCSEPQIVNAAAAMSHRLGDVPVVVEIVGVCGIVDYLREMGIEAYEYSPGKASEDKNCVNMRAEVWQNAARWLSSGMYDEKMGCAFSFPEPDEEKLILAWKKICQQLLWPKYSFRGDKVLIQDKEAIKSDHNGESPDYADMYTMGIYYMNKLTPTYKAQYGSISVKRASPPVSHPMGF